MEGGKERKKRKEEKEEKKGGREGTKLPYFWDDHGTLPSLKIPLGKHQHKTATQDDSYPKLYIRAHGSSITLSSHHCPPSPGQCHVRNEKFLISYSYFLWAGWALISYGPTQRGPLLASWIWSYTTLPFMLSQTNHILFWLDLPTHGSFCLELTLPHHSMAALSHPSTSVQDQGMPLQGGFSWLPLVCHIPRQLSGIKLPLGPKPGPTSTCCCDCFSVSLPVKWRKSRAPDKVICEN